VGVGWWHCWQGTLFAVNNVNQRGLHASIFQAKENFYRRTGKEHPDQLKFFNGWMNRLNNFKFIAWWNGFPDPALGRLNVAVFLKKDALKDILPAERSDVLFSTITVYLRERFLIPLSADSGLIKALLECQDGKVVVKEILEAKRESGFFHSYS